MNASAIPYSSISPGRHVGSKSRIVSSRVPTESDQREQKDPGDDRYDEQTRLFGPAKRVFRSLIAPDYTNILLWHKQLRRSDPLCRAMPFRRSSHWRPYLGISTARLDLYIYYAYFISCVLNGIQPKRSRISSNTESAFPMWSLLFMMTLLFRCQIHSRYPRNDSS